MSLRKGAISSAILGAEIMDETVKDIRMAATGQKKQQKEIDGLEALDRMRRSV